MMLTAEQFHMHVVKNQHQVEDWCLFVLHANKYIDLSNIDRRFNGLPSIRSIPNNVSSSRNFGESRRPKMYPFERKNTSQPK